MSSVALPPYTTGILMKRFRFKNIRSSKKIFSEKFYFDFSMWQLYIERAKNENDQPCLSIHLKKVSSPYDNQFSYHIRESRTLLSQNPEKNIVLGQPDETSRSRYVYGKRCGESMDSALWDSPHPILWANLLNPQLGYLMSNDHEEDIIEIHLKMEIVDIMIHNDSCMCGSC